MGLMDILVDEINKDRPEDEKFTRLHSEPYRIVKTNDGLFHVNRPGKGLTPFGWDSIESAKRKELIMTKTELIEKIIDLTCDFFNETEEDIEEDKRILSEDMASGDISAYVRCLEERRDCECKPFDGVHGEYDFEGMKKYDEVIDELKKYEKYGDPVRLDPHLVPTHDGHIFVSDRGIKYDLLEGFTMGYPVSPTKSSDIFFVMFNLYDCDEQDMVGWSYGAEFYKIKEYIDWMIAVTSKWEREHKDIVDGILNGEIKEF